MLEIQDLHVSVHGTPGAMVSPMRSARTPRRDTTAPEVSPPATRMRLTPVSTSAAAMSASTALIFASSPSNSSTKLACVPVVPLEPSSFALLS